MIFKRKKKFHILPKKYRKKVRKFIRKATKKENLVKVIILFITIVLLATSILPYIL